MLGASEPRYRPLPSALAACAEELRSAVRIERIEADVQALAAPRSRLHARARIELVEQWIAARFRSAGWDVERQAFAYESVAGWRDYREYGRKAATTTYERLEGANVLAFRRGTRPERTIVVGAHFDTVRDSPGADDNASGVAALLELAQVLGPANIRHDVLLAALDMEEIGFFGALALAERLRKSPRPATALILESIGYTAPSQRLPAGVGIVYHRQAARIARRGTADWTLVVHRSDSTTVARAFAEALIHLAGPGAAVLARDPLDLPLVGNLIARRIPWAVDFARSDHVPLWQAGIPAIQVTDTANFRNPNYHQPTDVPQTLDYAYTGRVAAATALVVRQLAGTVSTAERS
jgi:acetylornithine deacetylase/succinyl-diaminopimelate desuccinylase-like protein